MRGAITFVTLLASLAPTASFAQSRYLVEIVHGDGTAWVGSAQVNGDGAGPQPANFCLVRKEYINRPALPRDVLQVAGTIDRKPDAIGVTFATMAGGPVLPQGGVELAYGDDNQLPPLELWFYRDSSWPGIDEHGNPIPLQRPHEVGELTLRDHLNLQQSIYPLLGDSKPNLIEYYRNARDAEHDKRVSYDWTIYDSMTSSQARQFERGKNFSALYGPGMVLAAFDTAKIPQIQALLDAEGEGARILNAELAGCPAIEQDFVIAVPVGLELFYARKLQRSGLVMAAYPEIEMRDPAWSDPFNFTTAALRPVIRNPQLGTNDKYRALWGALDQSLLRFAAQRRVGFASNGGLTRLGGTPPFMYRAEFAGRSLALCGPNRWEKIVVQASANGINSVTGEVTITINFSDGQFGIGTAMPSDLRFKDNTMSDSDLGHLQELFVGTAGRGGTIAPGQRCH